MLGRTVQASAAVDPPRNGRRPVDPLGSVEAGPNAVPEVLRKTSRMLEIVAPTGSPIATLRHVALPTQRSWVACSRGWNSGDPGSGPISSADRDVVVPNCIGE